jgi:maleylpyruvate isomerase
MNDHTLRALHEATRSLIRTVDGLSDEALAEASLLPDWSRAHVVAHIALNAEALAGVMRGLTTGEDVAMYASQESRDAEVAGLAAESPSALRDRFLASCTRFQDAVDHMPDDGWAGSFRRSPGADPWPAAELPTMRWREVEIHHADLAAGYTVADWPEPFLDAMFNRVVHDREAGPSMLLRTPDGDVPLGTGSGPVVIGSRADLTWWLLGRGGGAGLTGDPEIPTLGPWR